MGIDGCGFLNYLILKVLCLSVKLPSEKAIPLTYAWFRQIRQLRENYLLFYARFVAPFTRKRSFNQWLSNLYRFKSLDCFAIIKNY